MNLALIPPVLPCAAGVVFGPIPPWLRVLAIVPCVLPVFVAASLFRLVSAYPGTADFDRWTTSAVIGSGSLLFTAAYLVLPVLTTAVLLYISVLWLRADRR